ncbi:MAG: NERD domain-containing protein [Actinobacteria bacterium]|nr:NERD domain-containing protein [Actinomycetota bacterium]
MPRLLPPSPEWAEGRHGERAVWEALRDQLPDEVALLHSVLLVEEDHEYEADLVVAWPGVGICVVEVKGGRVERDDAGRWWQTKAGQPRRQMGNPMMQASDCRHVLQRYLGRQRVDAARARTAHVLAFPHMALSSSFEAPDMPRSLVLDKDDLKDAAAALRAAVERHGDGYQPLTPDGLEQMLTLLSAQLPGQASLLSLAEEHEQRVDQLTRDQAAVLENLKYHRRLSIIGGAGTGKTWLALEQARRLTKDGKRVALMCYSRGLGRFLQRVSATWPKPAAYVGLFHDLPLQWGAETGAEDDSDYYERRLPLALGQLARQQPPKELFDAVVVDEAQDFGELWWPSLVACLRDPEHGGLFVFLDEAQRVFARTSQPPIGNEPYVLTSNIRNTKRIAQVFGSLTTDQAKYRGLEGPPVRFVQCSADDAVEHADAAVDALLDEWEGGQIALLTTYHRHPVHAQAVEHRGQQGYWDDFFSEDDVFYGHVLGFKGLERQVVVLAVDGFRDPSRAKEMLYVGLSRARTQLVVVGDLEQLRKVGGDGVGNRLAAAEQWAVRQPETVVPCCQSGPLGEGSSVSYTQMAHSHLQRMLREGMELDEVRQDSDGDYPFRHGTALYYLSVGRGGHMVKIWSNVVFGLKGTAGVLREINATNSRLMHCRMFLSGTTLQVEAFLPIQPLVPGYLTAVCHELGETADSVGQLMAAVHGGSIAFDDEMEAADD